MKTRYSVIRPLCYMSITNPPQPLDTAPLLPYNTYTLEGYTTGKSITRSSIRKRGTRRYPVWATAKAKSVGVVEAPVGLRRRPQSNQDVFEVLCDRVTVEYYDMATWDATAQRLAEKYPTGSSPLPFERELWSVTVVQVLYALGVWGPVQKYTKNRGDSHEPPRSLYCTRFRLPALRGVAILILRGWLVVLLPTVEVPLFFCHLCIYWHYLAY